MILKKWDDLPENMRVPEVREYYDVLSKHRFELFLKRVFDFAAALVLLMILAIPMLVIALAIVLDSHGGALFRQVRVTTYGKTYRIHNFRTMVADAERIGSKVTTAADPRVTKIGGFLRKYRLDELPQLLDVIAGTMSFVGTRPEVVRYVDAYSPEMNATLLLPAGITSEASIRYKDEAALLENASDADRVYIGEILPAKMKYNLASIRCFSLGGEIKTMFRTVLAVLGKDYSEKENRTETELQHR